MVSEIDTERPQAAVMEANDRLEKAKIQLVKDQHPYLKNLIDMLKSCAGGLPRQRVIERLERQRKAEGLNIPTNFDSAVQATFNRYNEHSSVFKKNRRFNEKPLFYVPQRGEWAVHEAAADEWLRNRTRARSSSLLNDDDD